MALSAALARPDLHSASSDRDRHRVELVIAVARGFLAAAALIAVSLDPDEPIRYVSVAYATLIAYDVHSALVLVLLWRLGPGRTARFGPVLHAIDVAWAVAITLLTEGPSSPFFPVFVFVLLAAAYRWGFRQTLLTGLVAVALLLMEVGASALGLWEQVLQPSTIIMRSAYLLLATFLLAYLCEQEKALRAEATVVNRMVGSVRLRNGLGASVQAVLDDLLRLLGSRRAIVVLEELASGRLFRWDARLDEGAHGAQVRLTELAPAERDQYLFEVPRRMGAWQLERPGGRGEGSRLAVDREGQSVRAAALRVSPRLEAEAWRVLLGWTMSFGEDWAGRLYVLDPTARPLGEGRLRFVQAVMRFVNPVLHNTYLLRRLRSRIGAIERARVARELHDSVVQSLIGVEMQLDVARRLPSGTPDQQASLAHIQDLLRQEILDVRDLMQQLRPADADSAALLDTLAELVARFRRETGIQATFLSTLDAPDLSPHISRELTRIVQEALVNVRRHSGASFVAVRFGADGGDWVLTIDDDGRGFDFIGSLSHEALRAQRRGPLVIRERADAIGGALQITSRPGSGARLEIRVPQRRHARAS